MVRVGVKVSRTSAATDPRTTYTAGEWGRRRKRRKRGLREIK
jgi:hypothetical protein